MSICQFYKHGANISSKEKNPSQQVAHSASMPNWCSHIWSPITEKQTKVVGAPLLICKGDETKCQLPKNP